MSGHRVFVYGTLQPGFHNWQRMLAGRVPRPWPAQIPGQLYDLPAGHPAAGEGEGWIRGYLLVLPNDALLARVDALEGFDPRRPQRANRYQRREVACRSPAGAPLGRAYAYFMTPQRLTEEGAIPLAEGHWPPSA